MSLSKSLAEKGRFVCPALPAPNNLISRTERILSRWPDIVANPPEKDRERLVAIVREHLEHDDWDGTRLSLMTTAARALFDQDRRGRPELAELRDFYCREVRVSTRPAFLGGLFSVYMESFDATADHTRQLAAALVEAKGRLGARWRALIESVPDILSPDVAADAIARKMVSMDDPWNELRRMGFRNPHAPGLMNAAHLAYVGRIGPHLNKRGEMERLFDWLKPEGQQAKTAGAGEAISALLGHWVSRNPSPEDLGYLTENTVGIYGDPRVQRGGVWSAVPPDRMEVILRWLTGENIRFFLDVVSAVEDSHMWEPRRTFWLGLHQRGRIDAAWVAFSELAEKEARRRGAGGRGTLKFGLQTAGYSRTNTSLLVLKIGRKIVVEGSHSYKVHIFDETSQRAPTLYQPRYDCEAIRLIPGAKAKSHNGDWQGWVVENI
ncbi:EH signature domain-containing protein [Rhizobium mayense]|uniref:EH signature domain-containing protein n=1 Tax=Rhizobium mayense TaxID=1312184 RepID=A0ABT7JQ31_9HYPH|nr:EH signature domain-containing protein [Rhizobium mayense]MDL2398452.1 EH signature domain-containing protein [Rhizobium mayense]